MTIQANETLRPNENTSIEASLKNNGELIVSQAKALTIMTNEDYQQGADLARQIKQAQAQIKDYWTGPKEAAHKVHAEICAKERAMLNALDEAERIVKSTMTKYIAQVEEAKRKAEEEMRKKQCEEEERFLQAAIDAEAKGDDLGVVKNMAMAEVVKDMAVTVNPVQQPKTEGVSARKIWRARILDDSKVPVSIAGAVIRPIDIGAIEKMAMATKGTLSIPGIELYQETVMSIRR